MSNIILGKRVNQEEKQAKETSVEREEIISKRDLCTKHFKNSDGTFTMEINSEPIHFLSEKTQQYEEIDNTFCEQEDGLVINANIMDVEFSKDLKDHKLFKLRHDKSVVLLNYQGKKELNQQLTFKRSQAHITNINKLNSKLAYEEIAPNVDLEYLLDHHRIKENIVIKQKQENYEFVFNMEIGDCVARLTTDERNIEIVDKSQKVKFIIPSPVMIDGNNIESDDVVYEFENLENGIMQLTVKANASWINDSSRVLPVKIDPQFISMNLNDRFVTHYTSKNFETYRTYSESKIGRVAGGAQYRHLMNICLSNLGEYDVIETAIRFKPNGLTYNVTIGEYTEPIKSEVAATSFMYNSEKDIFIDNETINSEAGDYFVFTDTFLNWRSDEKSFGAIILSLDGEAITIKNPDFVVTYTPQNTFLPSYYYNLGKRVVTETVTNEEINLGLDYEDKSGILTTIIDRKNDKIYQSFLVEEQTFNRHRIDNDTWSQWKKTLMNAYIIDDVLYLND